MTLQKKKKKFAVHTKLKTFDENQYNHHFQKKKKKLIAEVYHKNYTYNEKT